MDPFRDELAAAHAKIAQLEDDKRALEKELADLKPRRPEPPRKLTPREERRNAATTFAIYVSLIVVAGAIAFILEKR